MTKDPVKIPNKMNDINSPLNLILIS